MATKKPKLKVSKGINIKALRDDKLDSKVILKKLATLQKNPRIRALYHESIKVYRTGRLKTLKDIATNKKAQALLRKFTTKDTVLYRKLLEPIGFPKIQLKDLNGKKAVNFISARRKKLGDIKLATDKFISIDEQEKKVLNVMNEHIEYLGEESFFQKAHKEAKAQNILTRNEKSIDFYMEYAANYGVEFNHLNMLREGGKNRAAMQPSFLGRMFFYRYRPINPRITYDFYPLVFVLNQTPNYFEGINFHNMFIKDRALVLGNMYAYLNNIRFDKSTKILFNAFSKVIKSNKQFKLARASYRRYKYQDVSSKLIEVHPFDWEIAMMVSTERFYTEFRGKAVSRDVWRNTRILSTK
jgi:hypothetical protein